MGQLAGLDGTGDWLKTVAVIAHLHTAAPDLIRGLDTMETSKRPRIKSGAAKREIKAE